MLTEEQTERLRAQLEAQQRRDSHEAFFNGSIEDEDAELEKVLRVLRAESVTAYRWGRESHMEMLDNLIARFERHEHRR